MSRIRSASKTPKGSSAPKGRKRLARGNAPGHGSPTNPSPEGATEGLGHCETGAKLLASILAKRECDHHGVGKYRQPVDPATCDLPQLPSHWTWASPEQLSAASRNAMAIGPFGSNLKVPDYREDGVPLVFVRHIRAENFAETHYVTPEKAKELAAHSVTGGDLLITKMGEPPGDSAIYPVGAPAAIITADCIKWRLAPAGLDSKFFKYALRTETTKKQVAKRTRGVAQKKVSLERFKDIALPLPPLPEQRRIVARIEELFSRLDAGVAALRHAKAQLQRYRQSVLAAAVTGQLTHAWREQHPDTEPASELLDRILEQRKEQWKGKGKYKEPIGVDSTEGLPALPNSWQWTTVDSVVSSKVGNAFKSAEFSDDGVRLLRGENIEPGALRWTKTRYWSNDRVSGFEDLLIEQGDVIVAMDRPVISTGLKVAVARATDLPCLLVQRVNRLRPIPPITSGFIYLNVSTERFVNQLLGNQTGTQLPHITEKGVRSFATPFPPLAEQHQIVAEVEARTTAIDRLEAELDLQVTRSNRLRQSALASAFTGAL